MARPLRIQFPDAFYHCTCRGIEHRAIFVDDCDRQRFLELLARSLETYNVVLHAYILMTNHFHLLIQTRKGNCSEFMRHFNICYTGWFNWRCRRSGNLYQGRYHATLIDADNYLLEVSRYLHLNSVRVGKMRTLGYRERWRHANGYQWSSLAGYVNEKEVVRYVDYEMILTMVGSRREYSAYVIDGLRKDLENPFGKMRSRVILGNDDFVAKVKRYLKPGSLRDQPSYRDLALNVLEPKIVIGILEKEYGISAKLLQARESEGVLRGITAELLYKYCNITQSQIGQLLGGIDYGAVHLLRRRLREKMCKDNILRKRYEEIEGKVKNVCRM